MTVTYDACIKFARGYDPRRIVQGPPSGEPTMFESRALRFRQGVKSVPLVVDHDFDQQIGEVDAIWKWDWLDGLWQVARCTLSDPPPTWLKKGTKASFCYRQFGSYEVNGWETVTHAFVDEVSVLRSLRPVEPCAEVLLLERSQRRAPVQREPGLNPGDVVFYGAGTELWRPSEPRPAPGEVIVPPGQLIRRYYETAISVR